MATISYRYTGRRNDIRGFDWMILSPQSVVAASFPENPMLPSLWGYTASGDVSQGDANLLINPVNTSNSGTVYLCVVRFVSGLANNHLSKNVTLQIEGEFIVY